MGAESEISTGRQRQPMPHSKHTWAPRVYHTHLHTHLGALRKRTELDELARNSQRNLTLITTRGADVCTGVRHPHPIAHDPNTYTKCRPTDAGRTRSSPQRALLRGGPQAATPLWEITKSGRLVYPGARRPVPVARGSSWAGPGRVSGGLRFPC